MILLDTNVLSEPLKLKSDAAVLAWMDAQTIETLFLSAISLAALRFGIATLPAGRRKDDLHANFERRILPLFVGRILVFDTAASEAYAILRASARAEGNAIAPADGYLAATAIVHGLIVATRDTSPFLAAGLTVINPWDASS